MSTKNFTGTITLGAQVENVTATLVKRGLQVTGTLVFADDTDRIVPINVLIDDAGTSFTTAANQFFIGPNNEVVKLLPLQIADTTIDAGFTALDIAAAPCEINAVGSTIDLDLDAVVAAVDNGGIEDENDAFIPGQRRNVTPIRINEVGNQFDHFGSIVSLNRLESETNREFRVRITEALAKPANSSFLGLNRGIARDLGLSITNALRIKMKDATVDDKAEIRFFLNEKECILYRSWVPVLDQETGVVPTVEQQRDLEGVTIALLADWINLSDNFEAEVIGNGDEPARFLLLSDSREVIQEALPSQEIINFTHKNIIPGSVIFDSIDELSTEIDPATSPTVRGEYKIDYPNGKLTAKAQSIDTVEFTYITNRDDFFVEHCPVKIADLISEGSQDLYFNQVTRTFYTNERNHYVNGLPTNEMYGILRKVLTAGKFPQFWGE